MSILNKLAPKVSVRKFELVDSWIALGMRKKACGSAWHVRQRHEVWDWALGECTLMSKHPGSHAPSENNFPRDDY
jgi:hypothetical protein